MELAENGKWWIGPGGEYLRVIAGGVDTEIGDPPAEPAELQPAEPLPLTAEEEAASLREENARLRGENTAFRETRREPEPPRREAPPPVDPAVAEYQAIEQSFQRGEISDAERVMRLGALGAEQAMQRRERVARQTEVKTRDDRSRAKSGQKIAIYLEKLPGLNNSSSPEMQRVLPHLRAAAEELGLEEADPRAQALALERTFGPIDRSLPMNTREFERRRHPAGGGGGSFGEEPPPPEQPKSHGERIFDKLLPEHQQFFIQMRGSKAAAIKTLDYADEHQMRKQGRFR